MHEYVDKSQCDFGTAFCALWVIVILITLAAVGVYYVSDPIGASETLKSIVF